MWINYVRNRDGDLLPFDLTRIERAIEKAAEAVWYFDKSFVDHLASEILADLNGRVSEYAWDYFVDLEIVQDSVEKKLMEKWYFEIAKAYIIYRNEREKHREKRKEILEKKIENKTLKIIKQNWEKEVFDIEKIKDTYKKVSYWLSRKCKLEELENSFKKYVVDWMKTSDILNMLIKASIDLITVENTNWQFIAWRFAIIDLYKNASKNRGLKIKDLYSGESFKNLFDEYIKSGLYYKDFYKYYSEEDILKAWKHIEKDTDFTYNYTTVLMYRKRYLLNPNKIIKELPQEMYMAAALFLAIPEAPENRLKVAFKIYEYCSKAMISLPTPTLLNARTNYHQLSSCFVLNIWDDLRSIYHNVENMAQISKFGWWIWAYLWNIRSKWWSIRWVKWVSWWTLPWAKVINDTAIAVNQLWARAWAISVTLDVWHKDIYDFLDMQTETWDIRRKSFDVFPAVSIPDIFMKRVQDSWDWTLFDPKEIKDVTGTSLNDLYWDKFEKFYIECENNPRLELKEKTNAKDLFKKFLKSTVETGMPYVFFRDTVNKLNPNKHVWMIYNTQLCTEICQNTTPSEFVEESYEDWLVNIKYRPWETVVCNLASINIARVNTPEMIKDVTEITMRILDNVINLNFYPIKEAELTSLKYRSVWLWFLGLAEYLAVNKLAYDSAEAREKVDEIMETFAYETIKSSNKLAKERWAYELFKWSDWSKWIIIWKDKEWFKTNSKLDSKKWEKLIDDVVETWVRFAYHIAPAPNTSTASVVWTTAALLPIYKKYFIETNSVAPSVIVAPNMTEENFWFYKEYVNMNMNDVIDMMSIIYKWVDQSISFEWIINPEKVTPSELYGYYIKSWQQGIKTVYYVRSMSLDVKECVSCSG